jgi:hypothetical protein
VPPYFRTSAVAAVTAATSIIEIILSDDDIRDGLVGIPHYIHSMIAFACVFLLKIAGQYSGQYIEDAVVFDLATRAVQQFRSTPVGKWHLVHLMAEGLEKMLAKKAKSPISTSNTPTARSTTTSNAEYATPATNTITPMMNGENVFTGGASGASFDDVFSFGTSSFLNFDTGTIDLDFTGFGF